MGGRREVDGFHTVRSHSAGCLAPERKITEPLHACVCVCARACVRMVMEERHEYSG